MATDNRKKRAPWYQRIVKRFAHRAPLRLTLRETRALRVARAVSSTSGNLSAAAKQLDVHRRSLQRMIQRIAILLPLLILATATGCNFASIDFTCSTDAQCGTAGHCVERACALPAALCPSQLAYDKSAPGGRAGLCVALSVDLPDMAASATDLSAAMPSPTPQPIGAVCHLDADCEGAACVDGVCCDSACGGACATCNDGIHPGHCHTTVDGQIDPHHLCVSSDPCGFDGTCSNGTCALRAKDTVCAPQACAAGTLTLTRRCDGAGTCVAGTTRACDPYTCLSDGSDCYSVCTDVNTGCKAPNSCTTGLCGPAPNGAACSIDGACQSGHCVDGRCCGATSCGTCYSCNVAGHEGSCFTLPNRTTDARCPVNSIASCGHDGTCDGNGGCGFYPAGFECVHPYCQANTGYLIREQCPGAGQICPSGSPIVLACTGSQTCVFDAGQDSVTCQ